MILCAREIKDLAAVKYNGFNHCEIATMLEDFPEWGMRKTGEQLAIMWVGSTKHVAKLNAGDVLVQSRGRSGLRVLTNDQFKSEYNAGCCC